MNLVYRDDRLTIYQGLAEEYEGPRPDLVLTNPYGPLPACVAGVPVSRLDAVSPWEDRHPEGLVLRPWRPAPESRTLVSCTILRASDLPAWLERAPSWRPAVARSSVVLGAWTVGTALLAVRFFQWEQR